MLKQQRAPDLNDFDIHELYALTDTTNANWQPQDQASKTPNPNSRPTIAARQNQEDRLGSARTV